MNTQSLHVMAVLLACGACAPAAPAAAQVPRYPVAIPGGPAAPQPSSGHGNIVGRVVTNPWHAVKDGAVVYLEDGPRDPGISASGTLDNHDMAFVPRIVVIAAGGSIIFTNTDPVMHNVFTPDGDKWNLGEIAQNGSVVKRFDTPGNYTVLCNLHPSMIAYLVVSPSSYFARADQDGAFVIKNVPLGSYHVTAWVPRLKAVTQAVTLNTPEATANFSLER